MDLSAGFVGGLADFRLGGGYLGTGIGGEGWVDLVIVGSFGGGVEGREENRLPPGSEDAIMMAITERMLLLRLHAEGCSGSEDG